VSTKQNLNCQGMSNDTNLISEVLDRSVATTNTPDVIKMSHAMIHGQQHFSFLQSSPIQPTASCHTATDSKMTVILISVKQQL